MDITPGVSVEKTDEEKNKIAHAFYLEVDVAMPGFLLCHILDNSIVDETEHLVGLIAKEIRTGEYHLNPDIRKIRAFIEKYKEDLLELPEEENVIPALDLRTIIEGAQYKLLEALEGDYKAPGATFADILIPEGAIFSGDFEDQRSKRVCVGVKFENGLVMRASRMRFPLVKRLELEG